VRPNDGQGLVSGLAPPTLRVHDPPFYECVGAVLDNGTTIPPGPRGPRPRTAGGGRRPRMDSVHVGAAPDIGPHGFGYGARRSQPAQTAANRLGTRPRAGVGQVGYQSRSASTFRSARTASRARTAHDPGRGGLDQDAHGRDPTPNGPAQGRVWYRAVSAPRCARQAGVPHQVGVRLSPHTRTPLTRGGWPALARRRLRATSPAPARGRRGRPAPPYAAGASQRGYPAR